MKSGKSGQGAVGERTLTSRSSTPVHQKRRSAPFPRQPSCGAKQPVNKPDGNARENEHTEGKCPECGKPMRRMRSKGGKIYYGCTGYPQCKFLSWDIPTGDKCPKCGKGFLIIRGKHVRCSEKNCDYEAPAPEKNDEDANG